MLGRRDELEELKRLDLTKVAVSFGYELDRKKSSANSAFLRSPDGDAIIVGRAIDGHFIFCSVKNPKQSGSVIDFVAHRLGAISVGGKVNIGKVRQHLRPWLGTGAPTVSPTAYVHDLRPIERDIVAVQARWLGMRELENGRHAYLNGPRAIAPELLEHPRFKERIRVDARDNAAFAHVEASAGVVGFELKNSGFTGFSKGGRKTAFASTIRCHDNALVLAESAISMLSHAQLFGCETRRFMSLGGQVSQEQITLVRTAMEKLPSGAVILAFDNDDAGRALTDKFRQAFEDVGRSELSLHIETPGVAGKDWNDVLRERSLPYAPLPPEPGAG
jgi:hypothetical protein